MSTRELALSGKPVHIAITNYQGEINVIWGKPVSDEEDKEVNKN